MIERTPPGRRRSRRPSDASDETWTVGRLLTWTADFLKRRGSESPRLDAEVMLAHVLKWQRVQLYTQFDEDVGDDVAARVSRAGRRRVRGHARRLPGRPQGILFARLRGLPAVLIPRPESEFVVVEYLELTRHLESPRARRRGHGLRLPRDRIGAPSARGAVHRDRHQRGGPGDRPAERRRQLGVADRIDFRLGDQLEPVAGEGPSTRSSPTLLTSPRRRSISSSRESAITSRGWPSTAGRAGWTWLPG